MGIKSTTKRAVLVAISAAIVFAVAWQARRIIVDFDKAGFMQSGRIAPSRAYNVAVPIWGVQNLSYLLSRYPAVRQTITSILAIIALGYFARGVITRSVPKTAGVAEGQEKDKFESAEFQDYLRQQLRERTMELTLASEKLKEEISRRPITEGNVQHRLKQLSCFYRLGRLVERPGISLEQIFQEAVGVIRDTYQYPNLTCVRATFDGVQYKTDNFEKSELSQYAQIRVRGEKAGTVEIYYLGQRPEDGQSPFIKEERDLLDAVAGRLGGMAERKQAAERLQLFRNLIDRSNDCIFVIEPRWGRFLDINDRACESLGYAREELLKMAIKDIEELIPDDKYWQGYVEQLRVHGDIIKEGRHRRKDGATFCVETSLRLAGRDKEECIIAISRDITERRQAEQAQAKLIGELKTVNQKMEEVNQELKDFAYIVSHDLKAPLRGIKTLADWLSVDYADKFDQEGKEHMQLLLARVQRMHNLIDGVLQYSRVGRTEQPATLVDLNKLMPEIIDMVAPGENISVTVENELPVVKCEETRIIQVFSNLLSNAVKYMDKPEGWVKIGCVEENGFWKFSVSDNGPGIEEQHFDKIFKIFQTLSARDKFESTGIGLTVIKKIVQLYGGQIWLESKVGEGSTFFFTLPKQEKEIENATSEAVIAY